MSLTGRRRACQRRPRRRVFCPRATGQALAFSRRRRRLRPCLEASGEDCKCYRCIWFDPAGSSRPRAPTGGSNNRNRRVSDSLSETLFLARADDVTDSQFLQVIPTSVQHP